MQWRRATRKYKINSREKYLITQNNGKKKYYQTHEEYRQKQSNRCKFRYQTDEEYKNKIKEQALSSYYNKTNKPMRVPLSEANNLVVHVF